MQSSQRGKFPTTRALRKKVNLIFDLLICRLPPRSGQSRENSYSLSPSAIFRISFTNPGFSLHFPGALFSLSDGPRQRDKAS